MITPLKNWTTAEILLIDDSGDNKDLEGAKEDYATEVDEAFNENPDSIFEQIGLAKEEE